MAKKNGAPTKSEVVAQISARIRSSPVSRSPLCSSPDGIIKKSLRGAGMFTMPGLLKMKVVKKPATKARQGINPFTKEKMMFKAKPALKKVRVLPLKSLKALVNSGLSLASSGGDAGLPDDASGHRLVTTLCRSA